MTKEREALMLALEALEVGFMGPHIVKYNQAITAIKEALAQPEQERTTHITWDERGVRTVNGVPDDAPRPWVGLTENEIEAIEEKALTKQWAIRMALTAVKEKNT
jgi:hypothetical protein